MGKLNAEQRRSMLASIAAKRKNASAMPKSARPTAKTSQEDYDETKEVTETETKDVTDDDKEAKRFARKLKRRAYKIAQDEHAEEIERIVDDEEEDVADDIADAVSDEAVRYRKPQRCRRRSWPRSSRTLWRMPWKRLSSAARRRRSWRAGRAWPLAARRRRPPTAKSPTTS